MPPQNEIVDLDGKLAIRVYHNPNWNRPVIEETYLVSDVPAAGQHLLMGLLVAFQHDTWAGSIHLDTGRYLEIDARNWARVNQETPIAPPRNTQRYGWAWRYGAWAKAWFDYCDLCSRQHAPGYVYDDETGKCSRPSKRKSAMA